VEDGCDLGAVGGMKSCLMLKLMLVLYFVVDRVELLLMKTPAAGVSKTPAASVVEQQRWTMLSLWWM